MKIITKLLFFTVALNFMVGLLMLAVPAFNCTINTTPNCPEITGGINYDKSYNTTISNFNEGILSPAKTKDTTSFGGLFSSILDVVTFGLYSKIKDFLGTFLFGFINLIQSILSPMLPPAVNSFLFGGLKTMLILGVAYTTIYFITGKKLLGKEFD